mgnify:CR=1 FL=1
MSMSDIKELRARTGAGILDCKKALAENDGDLDKAIDWLRAKGAASAAKKAGRAAAEGLVHAYIHAGGKIGVLVEVNSETDFVARNEGFQELVNDIALHIAAAAPEYVRIEDVDAAAAAHEREVQKARVIEEGKPEHIADKIVDGRMQKWYSEVVLLEQPFVKDDKQTVKQMLEAAVGRIGENIQVRRFTRYVLGEGIEKRQDDLAAEVAKTLGG